MKLYSSQFSTNIK